MKPKGVWDGGIDIDKSVASKGDVCAAIETPSWIRQEKDCVGRDPCVGRSCGVAPECEACRSVSAVEYLNVDTIGRRSSFLGWY